MKSYLSAIAYVLMFLAIQAMASTIVTFVYALIKGDLQAGLPIEGTLITMLLFSVVTIVVFILFKWYVPSHFLRPSGSKRPEDRRSLLTSNLSQLGVLVWCAIAALGVLAPSLFLQELFTPVWPEWVQQIVDEANQQLALIMNTRGGYFVIALLAPITEEVVFRGAVLGRLLGIRPTSTPQLLRSAQRDACPSKNSPTPHKNLLAIVVSALLFALAHLNPAQMPHAFLIGLLLGWLFMRTGSILPGIIFHWANNTAAYFMYHLYPDPDATLSDIFGGSTSHVLLAVLFSLCIFLPALYQLHLRTKSPSSR